MKNYKVRTGCEIAGRWRAAGSTIALSDAQARELAPPFGSVVAPIEEKKDAKLPRAKRRQRRTTK